MNFFKKLFGVKSDSENNNVEELKEYIPIEHEPRILTEDEKNNLIEEIVRNEFRSEDFNITDIDPLFDDAARLIIRSQVGSTTILQRRMKLGYNRAGRLMDQLEAAGVVGPNQGNKSRDVLIKSEESLENYLSNKKLNSTSYKGINKAEFYEKNRNEIEKKKLEYINNIKDEGIKIEKEKIRNDLLEKERKRQLQKEVLKELIEQGLIFNQFTNKEGERESIPQDILDKVWNRDGGKCVQCGTQENLEFDHIIPFSKGGATHIAICKSFAKDAILQSQIK